MKRIEELENLQIADLERIADDRRIEVPEGLDTKLLSVVMVSSVGKQSSVGKLSSAAGIATRRHRFLKIASGAVATGIAACLAVMFMMSDEPKDTFDDPKQAYAELERTMSLISSKMQQGMELASEAVPVIEMDRIVNGKIEIK